MRRLVVLLSVLSVVFAAPGALAGETPNGGDSHITSVEPFWLEFEAECDGGINDGAVLHFVGTGYYLVRWGTLTGQVFSVENVNIDWLFTNVSTGETWTFLERGVNVVREGDGMLIVSTNGMHNNWRFGAHVGHRVFTFTEESPEDDTELFEAGLALDHVFYEACKHLGN